MSNGTTNTTNEWYVGRVMSWRADERYGFIAISSVAKADGGPHELPTVHDIFVHQDECAQAVEEGLELRFQVRVDGRRGGGYFRAHDARPWTGNPSAIECVRQRPATAVSPAGKAGGDDDGEPEQIGKIEESLEAYLEKEFPGLKNLGLVHRVKGYDEVEEKALVDEAIEMYKAERMEALASAVEEEFKRYSVTRRLLGWILTQGWFKPGAPVSPVLVKAMLKVTEQTQAAQEKDEVFKRLRGTMDFMSWNKLLSAESVLPLEHLPSLYTAMPVWYLDEKGVTLEQRRSLNTRYYELMPGNKRWSNLYRMFNINFRVMSGYTGEVLPPKVLKLIQSARAHFDAIVIATHHLDEPGRIWDGAKGNRRPGYMVLAFRQGVPACFILANGLPESTSIGELAEGTSRFAESNLSSFNCPTDAKGQIKEMLQAMKTGNLDGWVQGMWTQETHLAVAKP